jgi:hypothetical protein
LRASAVITIESRSRGQCRLTADGGGMSWPRTRSRTARSSPPVNSGCAVRSHYEDLLAVLANESLGESRIYFLRPVNRIGNRKEPGVGRTAIERFADHPQLGTEATLILARRGPND